MNTQQLSKRAFSLLAAIALPAIAGAETASTASATSPTQADVTKMDAFEVRTDADNGYATLNSNSITAFSAELNKLPMTADIMDQTFMGDIGAQSMSMEELIQQYSAGAGTYTPDAAATAAQQQPGDRNGSAGFALRGLDAVTVKWNGFMGGPTTSSGYTTLFDIERVEVINGPQALLYGTSGPGGVVNEVTKQARLGKAAFGSVQYQVDQYGNKLGQVDFGVGTNVLAVRFAAVKQTVGGRRNQIGGPLDGQYLQIAIKPFENTVIRVQGMQTVFSRIIQTDPTVLLGSASFDSRNGDNLHYLLATNQINAAASGNSGAGAIDNSEVNWSNVDSYDAWYESQKNVTDSEMLTVDTKWTDTLSSQLSVGYDGRYKYRAHNSNALMLLGPTFSTNTLGTWAVGTKKNHPIQFDIEPTREKALRYSVLSTNDLFNGKAHSQTMFGADFDRVDDQELTYTYFKADSNFNVIRSATGTRTAAPLVFWPVTTGPMTYPFYAPDTPEISLAGSNYLNMISNEVNPGAITPTDPKGVTLGGATNEASKDIEKGAYLVNNTNWMDDSLETLIGLRLHNSYDLLQSQGFAPPAAPGTTVSTGKTFLAYNIGANYKLSDWIRPYVSLSSSYSPPVALNADPEGNPPQVAHSIGEEVGFKLQSPDSRYSGSLALYHVDSKNEQYEISSAIEADINPSGLNGAFGAQDQYINVNRESSGIQGTFTASPTQNWRLRLSLQFADGTVKTTKSYGQLYNDQFYENASGQVTYKDGTVVYVPPTYNGSTVAASAAGAVPLTVALMNTPSSPYYAAPQPITGAIGSSQNVVTILNLVDPVHGPILTGATGLPISAIQISPAAGGVVIPGTINVAQAGDTTVGYPKVALNLTSMTNLTGALSGFKIGGSFIGSWDYSAFYYYSGATSQQRNLFKLPITPQFNGILGYEHKFRRFTWSAQMNVNNLFNHYKIILIPDEVAGYTTPSLIEATFSQQPRSYVFSSTLSF